MFNRRNAILLYAEELMSLWAKGFGMEKCKSKHSVEAILTAIMDDYEREKSKSSY